MPTTVNGIGTTYYGKGNVESRYGVCDSCGKEATLTSYDTRLYFVIVFIPVIPLGRKRIVEQCSRCRRHRHIPLGEWRELQGEALNSASSKLRDHSDDAQAVEEAIDGLLFCKDKDGFMEAGRIVLARHSDNAQLLALVGRGYAFFGMTEETVRLFEMSLQAQDEREVHEMLGEILIEQGRCDDAARHFQHIIDGQIKDKAGYLLGLAQGYQATGNHRKALEVLDKAELLGVRDGPNKKVYRKLRKVSEKNPFSNEPVVGRAMRVTIGEKKLKSGCSFRKIGLAAVVFVILFIYLGVAFIQGRATDVYFVNGLSKLYLVQVNGQTYRLPPMRAMTHRMPEGVISVEIAGDGPMIAAQQHTVKTSFFTRPFVNKTWVINPDAVAPILWEKIWYAARSADVREGEQELHFGRTLYCFDGIDHPFETFPEEIEMSGKREAREGLSVVDDASLHDQMFGIVSEHLGPPIALLYAKHHMLYEPEEEKYLGLYAVVASPEEFIEAVEVGLDARPIRINWHRFYQTVCERLAQERDLVGEYRGRLEKDPDDPILHYLLGRLIVDPAESESHYQRAVSGARPCPYGYLGMAYLRMSMGRYAEGLELIDKGISHEPDNEAFVGLRYQLIKALGRWDDALEYWREKHTADPNNLVLLQEYARLLASSGRDTSAKRLIKQWGERVGGELEGEQIGVLKNVLHAHIAYCMGDLDEYVERTQKLPGPAWKVECAVTTGSAVDPNVFETLEDAYGFLVLYISEAERGDPASARKTLSKATELLNEGSREERLCAKYLSGTTEPDAARACSLALEIHQKRMILGALGVKYPQHRRTYFELGEKLNCERYFPYWFLKDLFAKGGSSGGVE